MLISICDSYFLQDIEGTAELLPNWFELTAVLIFRQFLPVSGVSPRKSLTHVIGV